VCWGRWACLFCRCDSGIAKMIKKPVGRPAGAGKGLSKIVSVRLTAKQFEAVQKLGGREWIRNLIARETKK
jgi:hypothetical protein